MSGRARRSGREIVGATAIAGADLVWAGYAWQVLGRRDAVSAADAPWLVGIVGVGIVLDVGIVLLSRGSAGRRGLALGYLGVRTFLSAVGFLFLTLPFYLVAFGAIVRPAPDEPGGNPDGPHPFRPRSGGWFRALTPVSWSQNLLGASQYGASACGLCGLAASDPIHAPGADD